MTGYMSGHPLKQKRITLKEKRMINSIVCAMMNRRGVTAAEYAVMAVGIVGAVAVGAAALGPRLLAAFNGLLPGT